MISIFLLSLPLPHLMLVALQYSEVIGLATMAASVAVHLLIARSKEECITRTGSRIVQYPKGVQILVKGLWAIGIGLLILAGFALGGPHAVFALAFAAMFNAVVLTLHLLVFAERVTWDEFYIYIHPMWRRMRVVPVSSVRSCEFSTVWQQYRIHTDGHGMVKLNRHWTGIPELLDTLPCATPPYPPA